MNERIKELWDLSKTSGIHPEFGEYDMYSAEKFAELLVKDITTEVKMGIESSTINLESSHPESGGIHYWEGYRHASDDILVYIKEHFGVE